MLAHEHAGRELAQAVVRARIAPPAAAAVGTAELWRYARREHGTPADFRIEAALRAQPRTAGRYRQMLRGMAMAHSPLAMAAGSGTYPDRAVGGYRLRVIEDPDAIYLVLQAEQDVVLPPTGLEVHGKSGGKEGLVRILLSAPVRGHITVVLDRHDTAHATLLAYLAEAGSELFLL